jgi:hypothetical protein
LLFFPYSFQEELARDEAQHVKKAEEIEVVQENKGEEELVTTSEEELRQDEKTGRYFKPHEGGESKKLKEYIDWKAGEKPGPNETVPVKGGLLLL